MSDDNTCIICTETYTTKKLRVKTTCPYCSFTCCRKCCETFILNETMPRCMNNDCRREWTRHHLFNMFSKVFINKTLKIHRENILFDREVGLLPATQPLVEAEILTEKIETEIEIVNRQMNELLDKRNLLRREHYRVKNGASLESATDAAKRTFVRACPDENCRGFLSQQWKCGICEKYTCSECHCVKTGGRNDTEHVCRPDDVATATLIASDTKPCPKCATGIFKIDGCDQMYCTSCHTAFSWRTGRIETRIHNPHYYEWLRRTGGENAVVNADANAAERLCGGNVLNRAFVEDLLNRLRRREVRISKINQVAKTIESINHLRDVVLPQYLTRDIENNQELRISYMRNKITEKDFKMQVQRRTKKYEKNREIYDVLDMFINTSTDILHRFSTHLKKTPADEFHQCEAIFNEIQHINEYTNDCLKIISQVYASHCLKIVIRNSTNYTNVLVKSFDT